MTGRDALRAAASAVTLVLACSPLAAAASGDTSPPKLALVLSGGGARGAAHIGVLEVLEELHVRPDLIVGTSMGAIVGGLYASGWRPDEISALLRDLEWGEVFFDRVDRRDKSFRRKQDDEIYLVQARLRFKGLRPYLPPGVLGGQRLELMLRSLEMTSTGETDFDSFPIPFRAVATDITTGEAVVLGEGSLAEAMRASMSIGGVFPPVKIGGRALVDGGVAANLPIGIAQGLGADRVIAVDVSSPLKEQTSLRSFFEILDQLSSVVTGGNRAADVARLGSGDVLLVPDLGEIEFTDFERVGEAIDLGAAAARGRADVLRAFAFDDEEWSRFESRHARRPAEETVVDAVRVENESWVADAIVRDRFRIEIGRPLDPLELRRGVMRLAALDYFGTIRPSLVREDDRNVLAIRVPRKPYGRNSLEFGLSLKDDFEGGGTYGLIARHTLLAAGRRAGEWRNVAQIGTTRVGATEFYQPLDAGMHLFVAPSAELRDERRTLWEDGREIADLSIESAFGGFDVGAVLGDWGELRAGAFYGHGRGEARIGPPAVPTFSLHEAGYRVGFRADTIDSTTFPRRGALASASWTRSSSGLGSDATIDQVEVAASAAFSFGRNTIVPAFDLIANAPGTGTFRKPAAVGGFLRLSGLGTDELVGQKAAVGRLVYYRRLTRVDLGVVSPKVYAGVAVEGGDVYGPGDPLTWPRLRYGGALFVGAETVLGPAYLAWGWTEPGRQRLYLVVGQRF